MMTHVVKGSHHAEPLETHFVEGSPLRRSPGDSCCKGSRHAEPLETHFVEGSPLRRSPGDSCCKGVPPCRTTGDPFCRGVAFAQEPWRLML